MRCLKLGCSCLEIRRVACIRSERFRILKSVFFLRDLILSSFQYPAKFVLIGTVTSTVPTPPFQRVDDVPFFPSGFGIIFQGSFQYSANFVFAGKVTIPTPPHRLRNDVVPQNASYSQIPNVTTLLVECLFSSRCHEIGELDEIS